MSQIFEATLQVQRDKYVLKLRGKKVDTSGTHFIFILNKVIIIRDNIIII